MHAALMAIFAADGSAFLLQFLTLFLPVFLVMYFLIIRPQMKRQKAREALLKADSLDPLILAGLVYAPLGALYSETPKGFGGKGGNVKGIGYMWRAIVVDPDGLDSNYLYAELLVDEHRLEEAREILLRASTIPARPDHLPADRGRREQIITLLESVETRLQKST